MAHDFHSNGKDGDFGIVTVEFHSRMITFKWLDFMNTQEARALELRIIFMLSVLGIRQRDS